MQIAILVYDRFTALDAVGPYEVLRMIPDAAVSFVGKSKGPKRTDAKSLAVVADFDFSQVSSADILVVPGGPGQSDLMDDREVLDWVRRIHETTRWTTSVCTGSLVLAAAGLLKDLRATSHWLALDVLRKFGAEPTGERVVTQGKIITAAGVSAGIDMALRLVELECGKAVAQSIQLAIEYDPQPPVDSGSPDKAPREIVESVRTRSRFFTEYLEGRSAGG